MPQPFSKLTVLLGSAMLMSSVAAHAAPVTFFGSDANPSQNTPTAHPNSDATRAQFLANLQNPGTESLDGFDPGTTAVNANFNNGVTASLTGGVIQNFSSAGRFAISSPNYYNTATSQFSINFSSAISAFGFYGTDIGDVGGTLSLTLTDALGNQTSLNVGGLPDNGSVLYFGFYDTGNTYTSISFNNTDSGDNFGFDDFTVGTATQVVPTVPLPASLPMFGAAILVLGAASYGMRRGKAAAR